MRLVAALLLALCFASAAAAQRAQFPRKGRRAERSAPRALKPIRVLPRKKAPGQLKPYVSPLDQYLAEQRKKQPAARPLPEDRSRPLVRQTPAALAASPLPPPAREQAYDKLPRRAPGAGSLAGLLPVFTLPPPRQTDDTVPNRWKFVFPEWRRYKDKKLDIVYTRDRLIDPFNRNVLKGDYPFQGRKNFFAFTGSSDTLFEARRVPVPTVASAARPNEPQFFGRGEQYAIRQSFRLSFDLFRGSAGFKPVDWELRITPEFNINYLNVRETALTRADVRQGTRRTDTNISLQEAFLEKRLFTNSISNFKPGKKPDDYGSAYFDFTSLRFGIQRFTSDFRGFVFSDEQPGVRLFGTFNNNIFQYNLAYFNMLEKDTNSGLNRWRQRKQQVYVANLYWQDFLTLGYNLNVSLLYNNDQPTFHVDKNGFLVRPAPIGFPRPHRIHVGYAGVSGDGHIGRYNISHAFYQAFGRDDLHPVTRSPQHVNAQLAALEVAYEVDWRIYKASVFFTSGDGNVTDGRAKGFDAIVPNQQFAGGGFLGPGPLADRGLINPLFEGGGTNFLNRQAVPLTGTAVFLFGPNSLIPNLRPGLFQGQANYINPGIFLANLGVDAKLTPKLRGTANLNYLRFHRTAVLETLLFQSGIKHSIGVDAGFGAQYRPKLSDNLVLTTGFGVLFPHQGFKQLYNGRTLFSAFVNMRFLF